MKNYKPSLPTISESEVYTDSIYINASYIKDCTGSCKYIAAQTPIDKTEYDFWMMIWQEDVQSIVMLTHAGEEIHSTSYLPMNKGAKKIYNNNLSVKCIKIENENHKNDDRKNSYDIRKLKLKNKSSGKQRVIKHYLYKNWHHSLYPRLADGLEASSKCLKIFLEMLLTVKNDNREKPQPIVVHCHDGAGRTGSYIVIDAIIDELQGKLNKNEQNLKIMPSIIDYMVHIRNTQRPYFVANYNQYWFAHECLQEYFLGKIADNVPFNPNEWDKLPGRDKTKELVPDQIHKNRNRVEHVLPYIDNYVKIRPNQIIQKNSLGNPLTFITSELKRKL